MVTKMILITLGAYVLGIIMGRVSTRHRLTQAKAIFNMCNELLDHCLEIRKEIDIQCQILETRERNSKEPSRTN